MLCVCHINVLKLGNISAFLTPWTRRNEGRNARNEKYQFIGNLNMFYAVMSNTMGISFLFTVLSFLLAFILQFFKSGLPKALNNNRISPFYKLK